MTNVCKKTTLRTRLVYCSGKPQSIQVVCSPCCPRSCGHLEQTGVRRASDHPFDHPSRNVPDDKTPNDPKSSNQEANAKPNFNPGTDYTDGKTQQQIGKSSSDEKNSNDLKRFERDTTKKGNFPSRSSKNDAKKRSRSTSPSNSDEKASNDSKWSGRSSNRKRKSISSSGKRESSKRSQQLSPPHTAEKSLNESKRSLFDESKRSNTSAMTGMSDTKRGSQQKVQSTFDEKAFNGEKGGNLRNPNAASTLDRGATKKGLQPNEQSINVENPPDNNFGRLNSIPPNGRDDEHKRSQMTSSSISVEKSSLDPKKSVTNNGTKTNDAALDKMDQVSTQGIHSKDVDGTGTSERKKETNTQSGNKNVAGRANQASFGQKSPTADDRARSDDVRRANANGVDDRSARNGAGRVSQTTFGQKSPAPGGRAQLDEPRKANVNGADNERARNGADRVSQASFSSKSPTLSGRAQSDDPRRANANKVDNRSAKNGAGLVSQTAFGQKSPKADIGPRSDDPRKANANEVDKGSAKNGPDRVSPTSFGPKSPVADGKAQSNDQKKANASEVDNESAKNSPGRVSQTSFGPKSLTTGGRVQSDDLRKAIANEVGNGSAKNGPGRVSQASFGQKNPAADGRAQSDNSRKANTNGADNEGAKNGTGRVNQTLFGQKGPKTDIGPRSDDPRRANANEVDSGSAKKGASRVSQASFGQKSPKADSGLRSDDPRKANASEVDNGSDKNGPGRVSQTSFGLKSPTPGGRVQSNDPRKANADGVDNGSVKNGPGHVSQTSFGQKSPKANTGLRPDDPRKANANGVDNERARNTPAKEVGHLTISKKSPLCTKAFGPGDLGVPCDESGEADLTSLEGGSSEELDGPNGGKGAVRKEGFKTPRSTGGIGFSGIKKGNSTTPETRDDAKMRGSRPIHSAPNVRHTTDFSTTRAKGHTAGSGFYRNHLLGAGKNYLQPKSHPSLENLQGSENRTGKGRRTPNPSNRFARIEGSQYGYIDLVKELGMLDRNAVYYYLYVFLHQRDVDKELVPFETRRCIEKALETASSDEEERLRLCILNSKDRRLSKVELTTGCKIELGELTGVENCYRGLPRRRLNITGPSYVHIANAITMLEQYFPRLMRNATYPYPLPRGTTTKYETEERMATTAFRTVDHEPGNIGLRADFNDRALVTCRQVREAYEGA
ncbi:hypothetical protein ECG_05469 [Echinococcus granulosus]|uniref:Translation initiation factor IF-2 n=1 Tax=Echinococcus granulosus TaxID=6210 RepID=A0A068WL87_ECHGR|nr:hypothetical protein ECG_05469 [Echinococcus granulosus]CDS18375.1 hypothetical protein EgrG_000615300 [Echinococcus granulosus]